MRASSHRIVEAMVGRSVNGVELEQLDLPDKPYLPFPAAVAGEIIDFSQVIVRRLTEQLGVIVGNGHVPQQNDAGLIETPTGLLAVDHVQLHPLSGIDKLAIAPSDKQAIDKRDGRMRLPGGVTISNHEAGWAKIIAIAEDAARHPWSEFLEDAHKVGELIVRQLGLDAPLVEIEEVTDEGIVIAKPHQRIY